MALLNKPTKVKTLLFTVAVIVTGCGDSNISETNIDNKASITPEVKPKETQIELGENITKILDPNKVKELKEAILEKERLKKEKELKEFLKRPITERYKLGDSSVVHEISVILNTGNNKEKSEILKQLCPSYGDPDSFKIREDAIIQPIFNLIQHKELGLIAIKLIGSQSINGYERLFENKISSEGFPYKSHLFYWLGRKGKSSVAIDYAESLTKKTKTKKPTKLSPEEKEQIILGLIEFCKYGNEEIKTKAGQIALNTYKNKWYSPKDYSEAKENKNLIQAKLLKCIYDYAGKKATPVASAMLKKKIQVEWALNCLAKNNGVKEYKRIVNYLRDSNTYDLAIAPCIIINDSLKTEKDLGLVLLEQLEKHGSTESKRVDETVKALKKMKRVKYITQIDSVIKDQKIKEAVTVTYDLLSKDPTKVAESLLELGVISKPIENKVINQSYFNGKYIGSNAYIYNLLDVSDILSNLDPSLSVEQGTSVVQYLLTKCNQTFEGQLMGIESDSSFMSITLIYNNSAYIYNSKAEEDFTTSIIDFFNMVLSDSGHKSSFVPIGSLHNQKQFLFGPKSAIEAFKNKYNLNTAPTEEEHQLPI